MGESSVLLDFKDHLWPLQWQLDFLGLERLREGKPDLWPQWAGVALYRSRCLGLLVVPWLRLQGANAGGLGSVPGQLDPTCCNQSLHITKLEIRRTATADGRSQKL